MGRTCIKDHRPEHSLGDDRWLNGCAQCEIEKLRAELERLRSRTVTLPPLPEPFFGCARYDGGEDVHGAWFSPLQMRERDEYWIAALRAAGVEVNPPSPSA